MLNLKACVACLSTNVKLFSLETDKLRLYYNKLSGLQSSRNDGLPEFLCFECYAHVQRFIKFRDKCQKANFALKELLHQNKEIQKSTLEAINRKYLGIEPTLSYLDLDKAHYEQTKFIWNKNNRLAVKYNAEIPILTYGTLSKDVMFESSTSNGDVTVFKTDVNFKEEDDDNDIIKDLITIPTNDESDNYFKQSTSGNNENNVQVLQDIEHEAYFDSENESNDNSTVNDSKQKDEPKQEKNVDGSDLDFEYAIIQPLSVMESKAASEISMLLFKGKYRCEVCNKSYNHESRMEIHKRMHDKHISGTFECELCHYCYKTDFLLQTHMTEKHLYKYLCKKCPEVSFDRCTAKQHYIYAHIQNRKKCTFGFKDDNRPSWLNNKGGKRFKGITTVQTAPKRKPKKKPEDYPIYTPIPHLEQYQLIINRKSTKNYLESEYRCEFCFKGFRGVTTYNTHMKKHDPQRSGNLQCDMCKLYLPDKRKMYKHMQTTHLYKFSCQMCSYVCFARNQAVTHYKWHQNVIYPCPHCDKKFEKISTQLTHIRIKHPSSWVCTLCGHSFVSETGLYNHMKISHTEEENEAHKSTDVDKTDPRYCQDCDVQFVSMEAYTTHLGSSNKHATTNKSIARAIRKGRAGTREGRAAGRERRPAGRPRKRSSWADTIHNNGQMTATTCEVCGKFLPNDVQARKHYDAEHPGADYLKRYMCDVCGHTTKQYANLLVHMRTHTRERPYACPHCARTFSMPSNRDRHLVVHTGEKRYQCQHCSRRFTQSSAVKLHIQTVHLKIPYAPWDKKNRKRRKELEGTAGPTTTVDPATFPHPQKLLVDPQSEFLNAYITYNDE